MLVILQFRFKGDIQITLAGFLRDGHYELILYKML